MNERALLKLQLSLPSKDQIKSLSNGEVKNGQTINYKTLKPEKGGLFCPKIFGSLKDYECLCGNYSGIEYRNKTCPVCEVTVTHSYARRSLMGHIELAVPVIHIWFMDLAPSYLSLLLGLKKKQVSDIIDQGGVEVLEAILASFDLNNEYLKLRTEIIEIHNKRSSKKLYVVPSYYNYLIKRYRLIESFIKYEKRPEWMILNILPVLPADLRPIVLLKNNFFVTSDLNLLYRSIIRRNERLKTLISNNENTTVINIEKKMLQQSIDALIDNERTKKPIKNKKKEVLKSLSHRLSGKEGRFRHNLLGKRVNYSGRSVIIVGPSLKLSQCGLPLYIILELFKPFIYFKLKDFIKKYNKVKNFNKNYKNRKQVYLLILGLIEDMLKNHPILLNRAPTLHRMNIQAFEPIITNNKAILLHPLVCSSFNADFDGDQMAIHVPLSIEAKIEAKSLMMSSQNIINPANGQTIISPSQDIIFGLHYATANFSTESSSIPLFSSYSSIKSALSNKFINLQQKIKIKADIVNSKEENLITTAGRVLLYQLLPKSKNLSFKIVDYHLSKKNISDLVQKVYNETNFKTFLAFIDQLMLFGFHQAFQAGISFSKNDFIIPTFKHRLIEYSKKQLKSKNTSTRLDNQEDQYKKIITTWNSCLQNLSDITLQDISNTEVNLKPSIYVCIDSGARGSIVQMRQMTSMRGLMTRPSGNVIDRPILSNFKEGLNILEYFDSTHGSRKGVIDTSIKTATAGYLTRRLVNASQNYLITSEDCHTSKGIRINSIVDGNDPLGSFYNRLYGRVLAKDVINLETGKVLASRNSVISNKLLDKLKKHKVEFVIVRSVVTCDDPNGACKKCYGLDLSKRSFPSEGDAIGTIAAQSIGEPGTQLTMRTFHLGGISQGTYGDTNITSKEKGKVIYLNQNIITNNSNQMLVISRNCEYLLVNENYQILEKRLIPYGSTVFCKDGEEVNQGKLIAKWDPYKVPIISMCDAYIQLKLNKEDKTVIQFLNSNKENIILFNGQSSNIEIDDTKYLQITDGQRVSFGDIIGFRSEKSVLSKDITSDLSRISQIFEISKTKNPSIISPCDGYVKIDEINNRKKDISLQIIDPVDKKQLKKYIFSNLDNIIVNDNDFIKKGTSLTRGQPDLNELIKLHGFEYFVSYLVNQIKFIYLSQGVNINDKHIEVICKQMLTKVKIFEESVSANLNLIPNELIPVDHFYSSNIWNLVTGNKLAKAEIVIEGLTKSSLSGSSFISAAAFQKTSSVLADAAINSKFDSFIGPQESIIIGSLIPAGTGHK